VLTSADWAGLCALTETSRPEEQEYVLWVIRNRVESPRFPDTYEGVILQPKQFSAFNLFTEHPADQNVGRVFDAIAHRQERISSLLAAVHLAEKVLDAMKLSTPFLADEGWSAPFPPGRVPPDKAADVLHYYSPVSMKPPGSAPFWGAVDKAGKPIHAKRLFTPPGIDSSRFVFAEGVP
jgi:hypothetical protein